MDVWFAALFGLVQGLTEFLPISSTAHLRILPALFGQPDAGASFTAVIQLGTLVAVVAYFARDLFVTLPRAMIKEPRSPEGRLPWYLVLGTVPIVVFGIALKPYVAGDLRSLYVVAGALATVAGLMLWIECRPAVGVRALGEIGAREALIIGFAQAAALVPGVSRSGATITMALALGFGRPDAARFSFLLGIPAIAGAGVFELKDAIEQGGAGSISNLIVATAIAAVTGYAAIAWLLRYLAARDLKPFAFYRIALAIALVALCLAGAVPALDGR